MLENYYLGCPIWGNKDWVSKFFGSRAKPKDYLRQYAKVLNTVEGNTTFYGLPKMQTVMRWKNDTPAHFRFCFKFPRLISHIHKLRLPIVQNETKHFFHLLEPLEERLGILFLQLPPSFSAKSLRTLEKFLAQLPQDFTYSIEVRHLDFFDGGAIEAQFTELLQKYDINWALFHSSVLHDIGHARLRQIKDSEQVTGILQAQHKKPKMPDRLVATAQCPFLRYVGFPSLEPNLPYLQNLAKQVARWIVEGKTPYVFLHTPGGDLEAPAFCQYFHQYLKKHLTARNINVDVGTFPIFPYEQENKASQQLSLF